jgi:hypothetical protein
MHCKSQTFMQECDNFRSVYSMRPLQFRLDAVSAEVQLYKREAVALERSQISAAEETQRAVLLKIEQTARKEDLVGKIAGAVS